MNSGIIGQTLFDRYTVESFIAAGELWDVYRVRDLAHNVPLAMKVLRRSLADDPSVWEHWREAGALQGVTHPNIVPFYGAYQTGDLAFLLSGYVDGTLLEDIMSTQTVPIPVEEALIIIKAVGAALEYVHRLGVVHCDVKPGSVMIDRKGKVYLGDVGIAHHAGSMMTTAFVREGSAAYLSPEQCRGEPVTPAADIYCLGVMAYEMLAGVHPFQESGAEGGEAARGMRYAHRNLSPPDPRRYNPRITQPLAQVILRAMAKAPGERFTSAQEFFEAACAACGAAPTAVRDWLDLAETVYAPVGESRAPRYAAAPPETVPAPAAPQQAAPPPPAYAPPPQPAMPPAAPRRGRRGRRTTCMTVAILGAAAVCVATAAAAVVIFGPPINLGRGGTSTPTLGLPEIPPATQTARPGEPPAPPGADTPTDTPTLTLTPTRTPEQPAPAPTYTPRPTNTVSLGDGDCAAYCAVNEDCRPGLVCWNGLCWDDCICEGRGCPMP